MVEPVAKSGRNRVRLLAVYTHPIQYLSPLFRVLATHHEEIDLEVLYLTRPTAEQQGQGFGVPFQWDQDLMAGYRWRVFREPQPGDDYTRWGGLDAPGIADAIAEARPDVVLLPGWNCRGLVRALLACNRLGIPALYRGDTTLWQKPPGLRGIAWRLKNRLLLRRFSGFAAVGKRARIFLREHGVPDERIIDSPHAVDTERLRRDAGEVARPCWQNTSPRRVGLRPQDFVVLVFREARAEEETRRCSPGVGTRSERSALIVCGSGSLEGRCRQAGGRRRWAA